MFCFQYVSVPIFYLDYILFMLIVVCSLLQAEALPTLDLGAQTI